MFAGLKQEQIDRATLITIVVAALGYFVDIFDLLLFSIVRIESLQDLGLSGDDLLTQGVFLLNMQMAGLLIGGLVWGVWGDKFGRLSVLFGSILLYSLANIANAFVNSVELYAFLRFVAGVGLAGELGAGVTLASELLPKKYRGLGTTFIATIGVLGATFAALVAEFTDWRTAYMIGGIMGLVLLVLRINVRESALFQKMEDGVKKGDILLFFKRWDCFKRYLAIILIGGPIWGVVALFITFTPEFAQGLGLSIAPSAGMAVLTCYAGLAVGDMMSGLISQYFQSRKKSVIVFLCLTIVFTGLYLVLPHETLFSYYTMTFIMGIGIGYWAMFVQMGAEQFGTNIRATAAISIPNMVRAMVIPITTGFHFLKPELGIVGSGVAVMAVLMVLAFGALMVLRETFTTDLDYVET
ncbi:MAG: MFS transporter [Alphaproteobacteria bacterium]